jgi:hypothetical protein
MAILAACSLSSSRALWAAAQAEVRRVLLFLNRVRNGARRRGLVFTSKVGLEAFNVTRRTKLHSRRKRQLRFSRRCWGRRKMDLARAARDFRIEYSKGSYLDRVLACIVTIASSIPYNCTCRCKDVEHWQHDCRTSANVCPQP